MNHSANKPNHEHLPSDLGELASLLDAAGAASRAEPAGEFARRMFEGSRNQLVPQELAPAAAGMESLAAAERIAAGAELEASAFELSREAVTSGRNVPVLRLAPGDAPHHQTRVVVRTWSQRLVRIAAAVAVVGAGVLAYQMSNRGSGGAPVVPDTGSTSLAERVSTEMDVLLLAIDMNPHDSASVDSSDPDADSDSVWMDELFNSKESL